LAQRLYIADTADPAVRVVDLTSGNLSLATTRGGYFNQGVANDELGPVGLALSTAQVPGFTIESVFNVPIDGGASLHGMYFYLNKKGRSLAGGLFMGPGNPEQWAPPGYVHRTRQYRRGVLHWVGYVEFFDYRYAQGPTRQSFPSLDVTGIRYPREVAAEFQFEVGDVLLAPTLFQPEEATQILYFAEGYNYVVRQVELATPVASLCGDPAITGLGKGYIDGIER